MRIFKHPQFLFMKYKLIALSISVVIIAAALFNITAGKGINQGIDFAGGTLVRLMFSEDISISELRDALSNAGLGDSRIQEVAKSKREYMIRSMGLGLVEEGEEDLEAHEIIGTQVVTALRGPDEAAAIKEGKKDLNQVDETELTFMLEEYFAERANELAKHVISFRVNNMIIQNYDQLVEEGGLDSDIISPLQEKTFLSRLVVLSKESVGALVGRDLRRKATQATIWALIGMLIYIGIRFRFAFGVAALVTLGHDILITLGILSFTQREMNLPVIAAILTIVGYSLNDTIVIFDRVRDNVKRMRKDAFGAILDTSINQTLSRTVITSGTTLLTVLALFLFGGPVINDFAFTMIIGVIVGTYSSVFISCTFIFFWTKYFKPKKSMFK